MLKAVRSAARGRWTEILGRLGIKHVHLNNRHGPCPGCGGTDRFRFDDLEARGTFICGQGGTPIAGDGFALVMHVMQCNFAEAVRVVAEVIGLDDLHGRQHDHLPSYSSAHRRGDRGDSAALDRSRAQADARLRADRIWTHAPTCVAHPYLAAKNVGPHGTRVHRGLLLVPIRDLTGVLHSIQFIAADGGKKFLKGGRVAGCSYTVGPTTDTVGIAEGFATAATVFETSGISTMCAFNAGNLERVARAVRDQHPNAELIIFADEDDAGLRSAKRAARGARARLAQPSSSWSAI